MKSALLISLALVACLPLAGCGPQTSSTRVAYHELKINVASSYDDDGTDGTHQRKSGWTVKWTIIDHRDGDHGAFKGLVVHKNDIIAWECANAFSIMVTNADEWQDAQGKVPLWRANVPEILTNLTTCVIDSKPDPANDQTVILKFTPGATNASYGYRIFIPPIAVVSPHRLEPTKALKWLPSCNMIEATLSWDSTSLESTRPARPAGIWSPSGAPGTQTNASPQP